MKKFIGIVLTSATVLNSGLVANAAVISGHGPQEAKVSATGTLVDKKVAMMDITVPTEITYTNMDDQGNVSSDIEGSLGSFDINEESSTTAVDVTFDSFKDKDGNAANIAGLSSLTLIPNEPTVSDEVENRDVPLVKDGKDVSANYEGQHLTYLFYTAKGQGSIKLTGTVADNLGTIVDKYTGKLQHDNVLSFTLTPTYSDTVTPADK